MTRKDLVDRREKAIVKLYGEDFGIGSAERLSEWLLDHGYISLASLLKGKKKND